MAKVGGWENWETWQMAILLDMNEDLPHAIKRKMEENDVAAADARGMIEQTGDLLHEYMSEQFPEIRSPFSAFFDHAISRVNWHELGERFLKETGFLTRRGRKAPVGPKEWSP